MAECEAYKVQIISKTRGRKNGREKKNSFLGLDVGCYSLLERDARDAKCQIESARGESLLL